MWIALGIIGFLALLITVICLLPVKVIIKNDDQNVLVLRYKFLFKTFGENPDPNDPIIKTLKKAGGVTRLEKAEIQKSIQEDGLKKTVSESYEILTDLLREVVYLLKICVVTRLHVKIRCTGDDPAEAAVHYGEVCAVTYGLVNVLRSFVRIRRRDCQVDIGCDFFGSKPVFRYDLILRVSFGRVLSAFWRVVLAEAKRSGEQGSNQQK